MSYAIIDTHLGVHMNEIEKVIWEQSVSPDLAELSRKTGLVVRSLDPTAVGSLFAELEECEV